MNRTTARMTRLAMLLCATVVACKPAGKAAAAGEGGQQGGPPALPELSARAKVALDSGNVLYRSGSAADKKNERADAKKAYSAALVQYRLAAKGSPENAAPLIGVYMSALALEDRVLADSVYKELQVRGAAPPPGAMHSGEPEPTKSPGNPHAGMPPAKPPAKGR